MGDLTKYSIKELYDRQFKDFLKIWVATEGTHKIMNFISTYSEVDQSYKIEHPCQVCEKIFNDKHNLDVLRDNYRKIYSNVILKYFINLKDTKQ